MESGFTWNTQDQELDKKLANETWLEAEKFLSDPEKKCILVYKSAWNV